METDHVKVENIFKGGHGMESVLPLLATMGRSGDFGGVGGLAAGGVGGLLLGGLLGNRGGLFGGYGDGNGAETRLQDGMEAITILSKLGSIQAEIPLAQLNTQNSILQQTIDLSNQISAQTASLNADIINVKDEVYATSSANLTATNNVNQNVLNSRADILAAIAASTNAITSKIDAGTIANLQAELAEVRATGRSREVEVNVTQNVNQVQAQAQQQAQIQALTSAVGTLIANHQNLQQGIINLGTMTGNSQTAANTRVN